MATKPLKHADILNYLPHRFENVLLDQFSTSEEGSGEGTFELSLKNPDPYHRELFTKNNQSELLVPISMEVLALSAILSSGKIDDGYVAFFAGISNFEQEGHLNCTNLITGSVKKTGEKAGFFRFSGSIESNTGRTSGTVIAFFTKMDKIYEDNPDKKRVELPQLTFSKPIQKPSFKDRTMFLADEWVYHNKESQEIICKYTYPNNHPLTKGHFPGNPIMMGVMQWMMIEDAGLVFAKTLKSKDKSFTFTCDAIIAKPNGTLVCDIKKAELNAIINLENKEDQVTIKSTKKVTFRDTVQPNDTLLIHLYNISI